MRGIRPQRDPHYTKIVLDPHRVHTRLMQNLITEKPLLPITKILPLLAIKIPLPSTKIPSSLPNSITSLLAIKRLPQLCQHSRKLPNAFPDISNPTSTLPKYPPELPSSTTKLPNKTLLEIPRSLSQMLQIIIRCLLFNKTTMISVPNLRIILPKFSLR